MDEKLARRLADKMANQAAVRRDFHFHHGLDEMKAMLELAKKLFGNLGMLEAGPQEPGKVYIGHYVRDDKHVPAQNRERILVLCGNTIGELTEQAKLLGIVGLGL